MKGIKRLFVVLLVFCTILMNCVFYNTSEASTTKYGFTYDETCYNVQWQKAEYCYVYSELGGLLGTMTYYVGLARKKGTNDYIIMVKEVMTPNKKRVNLYTDSKGMITGYGLSEYVSVKTTLPSLDDYYPKNNPSSDSISFSIGVSSEKKADISASYTITHNDLNITSSCNTPKRMYYVIYDYKPNLVMVWKNNKYVANESVHLGEAQFEATAPGFSLTFYYDVRFGAASNSACSPLLIYKNYIRSAKKTRSLAFSVPK